MIAVLYRHRLLAIDAETRLAELPSRILGDEYRIVRPLGPVDEADKPAAVVAVIEEQDMGPGDAARLAEDEAAKPARQPMEKIAHGHQVVGAGPDPVQMPDIEVTEIDPSESLPRAVYKLFGEVARWPQLPRRSARDVATSEGSQGESAAPRRKLAKLTRSAVAATGAV